MFLLMGEQGHSGLLADSMQCRDLEFAGEGKVSFSVLATLPSSYQFHSLDEADISMLVDN